MEHLINKIILGDCLNVMREMPDASVDCIITSPPYYNLRDYGVNEQIGNENTPDDYIARLTAVFNEARRVLKDSGTLWVNLGDSYSGSNKGFGNKHVCKNKLNPTKSELPPKSLIGIPWRFALAMQDKWILRQDIIWSKPNPMPESVKDRFCKSHEYIFLFSKNPNYYFDYSAALEESDYAKTDARLGYGRLNYRGKRQGQIGTGQANFAIVSEKRLKRSVWNVSNNGNSCKHFATFPQKLITTCILCGCPKDGIVLDPFMGSGTTAIASMVLGRRFIGCEINQEYHELANQRLAEYQHNLFKVSQ